MQTRCIEAGIFSKTVQKYPGYSTLQMTMDLYVHTTDESMQKELEKLDTVFMEKVEQDKKVSNLAKRDVDYRI